MLQYIIIAILVVGGIIGVGHIPGKDLEAQRFLENQGYSEIKMTGYKFWGCGNGDIFKESFIAINGNGKEVSGIVCWGLFKGKTPRFN